MYLFFTNGKMELRKVVTFPKSPSDRFPSRTRIQVCLESVPLSARHQNLCPECASPGTGQWEGPTGLWSQGRSKDHQVCALSHVFPYFPGELKSNLSYIVFNCFLGPTGQCTWGNDTFYDLTLIEYNQFRISKVTKFLKILGSSFFFFQSLTHLLPNGPQNQKSSNPCFIIYQLLGLSRP